MDYFNDESLDHPEAIYIDDKMKFYLDEYGKWGKLLAIIAFIGIGLVVVAIIIGSVFIVFTNTGTGSFLSRMPETMVLLFYVLIMALYFFPTLYLYRSSVAAREAVRLDDDMALVESFKNLKSLFKFVAIFSLVGIGLYILLIVGLFFFEVGSFLPL